MILECKENTITINGIKNQINRDKRIKNMVNFLTRILELKKKIFLKRRMYIPAIELTGLTPNNLIQNHTKKIFSEIINNNPGITLDNAILIFEKAPSNISLEQFAISKHRTVASYRKVYKPYF